MSGTGADANPFDQFDHQPNPEEKPPSLAPQPSAPAPEEDEQAAGAREARESAGRVPRRRAQPESQPGGPQPTGEERNVYDAFDKDPKDDGIALMERMRLNRQDAFYRGSVAGSARLATMASIYSTPDKPNDAPGMKQANKGIRDEYLRTVADLAAYDQLKPWSSTTEAAVAFGGQLEGTMISPESWIGWGAKGSSLLWRTVKSGLQQGAIQTVTDPIVQELSIAGGGQQEYDPMRTLLAGALGFTIGGGAHVVGEGLGHIVGQAQLRKQLTDLGREDPNFDAPRHAAWALDPNNGIQAPPPEAIASAAPRADAAPPPARAPSEPGLEIGFQDAVLEERSRLTARYGAAQPKPARLREEARFNVFQNEAGPILDQAVAEHQLGPEHVRYANIWQHYDRQPGEAPRDALERAIGKWVSQEERAATQSVDDAQLQRDLDEWAKAYNLESDKSATRGGISTDFRGEVTPFSGISPVLREYRPNHVPEEDIPFERPGPDEKESRPVPPGGEAQPAAGQAAAGGGAEPAIRGERGGERPAAGEAGGEPGARAEGDAGSAGGRAGPEATAGLANGRAIPEDAQGIAQRRKGGKMEGEPERQAREREETPSPEEDIAIRSLQQQSMDLGKALDFPLHQGRLRTRTNAGEFMPRTGVVRVREVPDFDVVSHEAGHAIESKLGREFTDWLQTHTAELQQMDYDYPAKKRVSEGFAEAVRYYLTNPAYLDRKAPTFAMEFRQRMAVEAPELKAKLDAAADAYKNYIEAPSVDAVGSVRRSVDEEPGTIGKVMEKVREDGLPGVIKAVVQKSYEAILDDKAPIARVVRELGKAIKERTGELAQLKAADNPEVLMRLLGRARQGATRDLMDGVRPYQGIVPEGPSLADAITDAIGAPSVWGKWDEDKKAEFSTFLIARRAEYLWRKFENGEIPNPPVSFSRADAAQTLLDLSGANPNFANASDMVHEYTRQMLRKSYEGGLITADLFEKLGKEEFYVPFMRDMGERPNVGSGMGQGGEGPGTTQVVRRLRGSARDIKDPLESIMAQTFMVNRTLRHNDVIKAFVDLARRAGPEGGKFVEPIPAHEARAYVADLEQAIQNRAKELGMDPDEATNIIAALGDPEGGPVTGTYFKMEQAAARGEPIVFYREGGELKAARFMAESEGHGIYNLLTAAPEPVTDLWMQMIGAAASIKRSGIITNPTFALTNYFRDQVAASILRSDYVPIVSGLRGLADEFRQGQTAVLYGYTGGVAGGAAVGPVEKAFETEVNALAKKGYLVNRLTSFKGLMELASFTEAGTRNSIFGKVFEASKRKGLSDYEAAVEAAFQAQDMLDFSRHGSRTMRVRNFLPFLNAHIQGLDKARRTLEPLFRERVFEGDVAARQNAINTVVKFGAVGGALGAVWAAVNWDKEAYRDANPYFKGTHFVVPFGNKILVVPKPFELGLGFTAGEYAYHALAGHDPRAARMFAEATWQTLQPPNPFTDIPLVSTTSELTLGKSLFTGRDIVPERLQRLPANQQFDDRTSELAKWLGKITGMSPIKIEYAIGSEFGTWGRDTMALSQGVNENSPALSLDDAVFTRRFVKDPTRSSDATLKFWEYASRTTGKFNQDVAGYNDLVREAAVRGQSGAGAKDFLDHLPVGERAFVTLKSAAKDNGKPAFTADERRLHPLQHAYDAVTVLNNLRREIATNTQTTFGAGENVKLNPQQRRLLLENVRELAQLEMRNSLVIMGEGGYASRPVFDPHDTMDKIRAISPAIAEEIGARYATAKIYSTESIRRAWPELRDQLARSGSDADIRSLEFDAKGEGYEFNGQRARRPAPIRRPIAGKP